MCSGTSASSSRTLVRASPDIHRPDVWSGRVGFILASTAAAVGIGSIWKFPYEVGTNGGGGFVFFYVLGLILVVFPLMLAELSIGRRGRSDAAHSIIKVALESSASRGWAVIGIAGAVTAFLILSFYSVIGGWAMAYVVDTARHGLAGADAASVQARFASLLASPWWMAFYHGLFACITAVIVGRGIGDGIEKACLVMMPVLVVLLALLALYSSLVGDLARALRFLFSLELAQFTPRVALEALGLGFFSIGVGITTMIAYAAYAESKVSLRQVAAVTIVSDTAISFLAGLAIFPIVFAEKLDPAGGPGLMFVTLPLAFARLPFGTLVAGAFFLLLALAAIGSAIAMLELIVSMVKNALGTSRAVSSVLCAFAIWLAGLPTVLSFNLWSDWFPLAGIAGFARANVYEIVDYATSNLLLPVCGFGLAIFAGWMLPKTILAEELSLAGWRLAILRALLRYVVPIGIGVVTVWPLLQ